VIVAGANAPRGCRDMAQGFPAVKADDGVSGAARD
jgi:hypothetical protein